MASTLFVSVYCFSIADENKFDERDLKRTRHTFSPFAFLWLFIKGNCSKREERERERKREETGIHWDHHSNADRVTRANCVAKYRLKSSACIWGKLIHSFCPSFLPLLFLPERMNRRNFSRRFIEQLAQRTCLQLFLKNRTLSSRPSKFTCCICNMHGSHTSGSYTYKHTHTYTHPHPQLTQEVGDRVKWMLEKEYRERRKEMGEERESDPLTPLYLRAYFKE